MKKFSLIVCTLLLFFSCGKENLTPNGQDGFQGTEPLPVTEIDKIVIRTLEKNNQFKWSMVDAEVSWSALVNSDSLLSIGYKPTGAGDINDIMHLIDLNAKPWADARLKIMKRIVAIQNKTEDKNGTVDNLEVYVSEKLPYIQIKTGNREVLESLLAMQEVRYAEPLGYGESLVRAETRSGSGCGGSQETSLPAGDYTTYGNNGIAPWNYDNINVKSAWTSSQGAGITVGLIDTGVSDDQDNLGSEFAVGSSTGRTIEKYSTYVTCSGWWWWRSCTNAGPNDQCGHGTTMAGYIASPLGTSTQSTMGVAYKANLISYRGTGDVIINSSEERQGVSDALYALGGRSDVDIISMSIGDVFYNGQVADAVVYAYNNSKLIFSAAGTSTWFTNWVGVIFPANMAQTVAVTGVTDRSSLKECNTCHYGSEVDFSIIMQRDGDSDRTSLSIGVNHASPINYPQYVGGSSCATATTAGIAALVWSKNPGFSRSQVINKLKQASSEYPNKDSDFGWGVIDAAAAVN